MDSVSFNGQKLNSNQYYLTKCNTPFPNTATAHTVFTDPNIRPALIEYFFVHTMNISENDVVQKQFAAVSWPKKHPRWFDRIGKPYEVWCFDVCEESSENSIVPLSNNIIVSVLLTATHKIDEESVLVTVPLVI